MPLELSAYPHLFDKMLEAAPRESLLALRGVCRSVKDRVDKLMLYHIVVFSRNISHQYAFIHGPKGERIPCTMAWNLAHPESANDEEFLRPAESGADNATVRILDIRGWVSARTEEMLCKLRPELSRIIADEDYEITATEFDLASRHCVLFGAQPDYVADPYHGRLPPNTLRAVVVVPYDTECQWYTERDEFMPSKLEELVVIFVPLPLDDRAAGQELLPEELFIDIFGRYALSQITRIKITLVNVLCVPVQLLGVAPDEIEPDTEDENDAGGGDDRNSGAARRTRESIIRAILIEQAMEERRDNDEASTLAAVRNNIRILTMDEYRAQVGDEQFALETERSVPSEDMPPELFTFRDRNAV